MISEVIFGELRTAFAALYSGAFLVIVYDLIRIFRRLLSHGNFWIGIEDLIFWIWAAFWIFSVLYRENDGSLRMYTLLFMAFGMLLYHFTISEVIVNLFGSVLKKRIRSLIMRAKKH